MLSDKAPKHPTAFLNQLNVTGFVCACWCVILCHCLSLFFISSDLLRTGQDQRGQFLSCPWGKYNKPAASLSSSCGSVCLYCLLLSRFNVCTVNFLCLAAFVYCLLAAFQWHSSRLFRLYLKALSGYISSCFCYFLMAMLHILSFFK